MPAKPGCVELEPRSLCPAGMAARTFQAGFGACAPNGVHSPPAIGCPSSTKATLRRPGVGSVGNSFEAASQHQWIGPRLGDPMDG